MRRILGAISALLLINGVLILTRSGVSNTFILNMGLMAGSAVYTAFYDRLRKMTWLNIGIVAFAALYMGLGAFALIYGRNDSVTFQEDVAIVLGAGLWGGEVSPTLRNRLDMAVYYHIRNPEAMIIVSGGQGRGEVENEAAVMARYLVANGVPAEMILQEGNSHSTYENMQLSIRVWEAWVGSSPHSPQAAVITNDFHIFRSVQFARMAGFADVTGLHGDTPLVSLPGALVREVAAIVKMWLIGT